MRRGWALPLLSLLLTAPALGVPITTAESPQVPPGGLGERVEIRGAGYCWAGLADGGVASFPRINGTVGELSWRLHPIGGGLLRVDVNYSLEFSELTYRGSDLYREALEGNLSFVRVVRVDRVDGVEPGCPSCDVFHIKGRFSLGGSHSLTVNASSGRILSEGGATPARWLLWVNPARYPLSGEVREPALLSWGGLEGPLEWTVRWAPLEDRLKVDGLSVTETLVTSLPDDQVERVDRFFLDSGLEEPPVGLMLHYVYDARTGLFLTSTMNTLADDYLYGWIGVLWLSCLSPRGREGIEVHPFVWETSPPGPDATPLYAAAAITAGSAAAYLLLRRRGG